MIKDEDLSVSRWWISTCFFMTKEQFWFLQMVLSEKQQHQSIPRSCGSHLSDAVGGNYHHALQSYISIKSLCPAVSCWIPSDECRQPDRSSSVFYTPPPESNPPPLPLSAHWTEWNVFLSKLFFLFLFFLLCGKVAMETAALPPPPLSVYSIKAMLTSASSRVHVCVLLLFNC